MESIARVISRNAMVWYDMIWYGMVWCGIVRVLVLFLPDPFGSSQFCIWTVSSGDYINQKMALPASAQMSHIL